MRTHKYLESKLSNEAGFKIIHYQVAFYPQAKYIEARPLLYVELRDSRSLKVQQVEREEKAINSAL